MSISQVTNSFTVNTATNHQLEVDDLPVKTINR